jgi:hypothetical protein
MRASRIRPAELLAGGAGLALLAALFMPWFGGADGWEALTVIDLLLAITGAAAVALPVISASNSKTDAPITATALTVLAAGVSSLLVFVRLLDPVGQGSRRTGLYLALGASLAIAVGAWRAMTEE